MAFVNNNKVKDALDKNGTDRLPLILVDNDIVIEGRYPKNEEIIELLQISKDYLESSEGEEPNQSCCGNNSSCC
ncbi:arsenical resistance operon trans-acting repressor ArsD domain protein [Megasphaera vaginalis (ex Srinivasan et al. 2021)]|uniref:Arsenical resistance operon trans-acting repressor ArsD domain protein n=2 Tax=Megasphaera vaginalis (ex Srinivasan et al. 2021) TaxID=1111454 RepID=U7UKT6_9FIRM|nr:arsenical resistance operon trans-acting repressor ArsD domain protein [Megasphaera vaginalis (ex Srinivasan et al. 2021)]